MGATIHPTSVVDPKAELADGVKVGPFTVIGPNVKIGKDSEVHNLVTITGHTYIGERCQIFPGAVLGVAPQDLKFKGGPTTLEIGSDTIIREYCTLHPGTELGGHRTVIGDHNLIMAYVHIAHDCKLENHIVIANAAQLAGHVHVREGARISGLAAIHHFITIGRGSFVAGCARLTTDVPPFTIAEGHPARIRSLNLEGIRRRNMPEASVRSLKEVFRLLFRGDGTRDEAYAKIQDEGWTSDPVVKEFVEFVHFSDRGKHGRGLEAERAVVPANERDGTKSFTISQDRERKAP